MTATEGFRQRWAGEIRAARAREDITQEALAVRAGVSRATVVGAEKGEATRAMFLAIAGALGLDLLGPFRDQEDAGDRPA